MRAIPLESPFKASVQYFVAVLGRTFLDGSEVESALSLAVSSEYTDDADRRHRWREWWLPLSILLIAINLPPKAQLQSYLDSFQDDTRIN